MRIFGAVQTNLNLFDEIAKQQASGIEPLKVVDYSKEPPPPIEGGTPIKGATYAEQQAEFARIVRENNIKEQTERRENFYNSVPRSYDFNTNIGMDFTELDMYVGDNGQIYAVRDKSNDSPNASGIYMMGDYVLAFGPSSGGSPLELEDSINTLKNIYNKLGEDAAKVSDRLDEALQFIIDDFTNKGGVYVQADKDGIADSIRAILNGQEGKYSIDDMKTMAVLSFERLATGYKGSYSEHSIGALLGYDALSIEMARSSGKLSDAAYKTVQDAFNANANDYIKKMNEYLDWAKNDRYMPKNVAYSPARPESIQKAIDVMLAALDSKDFNQGLRFALRTLEDMHNAQRDNNVVDHRYHMPFLGGNMDKPTLSITMQFGSKYFAEYLGKPEWAVSGNVFSVDKTV